MERLADLTFLSFAGLLFWTGLSSKARFAAWRMFSRSPRAFFKLHDANGPIEIWKFLPHSSLAVYFEEIFQILCFLNSRFSHINGLITLVQYPLVMRIRVQEGQITLIRRRNVARLLR